VEKDTTKLLTCALVALAALLVLSSVQAAFPVWPDDGVGDKSEKASGDATVDVDFTWWDNYPYMVDGTGTLQSGSGIGYYSTDVSWETTAGEVNNAVKAVFKFEVDYQEDGDATGELNAYLYRTFRVYKWTGTTWNLVGQDTDYIYDDFASMSYTLQVNHNFDSSRYKFRFIHKVYWDEPQIIAELTSEIADERQSTSAPCLYIDD